MMRSSSLNGRPPANNRPAGWPGHLEITSKRLLSILERAAGGATDISIAERSLFMACEFWAATKAGTLAVHLGGDAPETLQIMSTIFSAIGAAGIAGDLNAATAEFAGTSDTVRRGHCCTALQRRLLATTEPVDTLLARFAVELFGNTNGMRRRARIAADS